MHVPRRGCRAVRLLNHRQLKNSRLLLPQAFRLALLVGCTLARRHFVEGAPVRFHPHVGVAREHCPCPEDVPGSAHDSLETGACVRIAGVQSALFGSPREVVVPPTSPAHGNKNSVAVPVTATGQLSCSCLVQKRKNFVSRGVGPLRCAP